MCGWMEGSRIQVMGAAISSVYVLVDWHNVQGYVSPNFDANPRRYVPIVILRIQQQVAQVLTKIDAAARYRATMRIYHGWHRERESTTVRRDFEMFANDTDFARRISRVSFASGFQFGNNLACGGEFGTLFDTYRGNGQRLGQKMIDTAIACDLLHLLQFSEADYGIIVSDDDDFVPVVITAKMWKKNGILLRRAESKIDHIIDSSNHNFIAHWSEQ